MKAKWHDSYYGKLRELVGNRKLLTNSVRAILCNGDGHALFIRRRGDGKWGMPAGAMELDESIYDCLVREVKEETGLTVLKATLIAIYSSPAKQSFVDRYGNHHQVIEYLFRVDEWAGTLMRDTDESVDADFFPLEELPEASNELFSKHHDEVFDDYRHFNGAVFLK